MEAVETDEERIWTSYSSLAMNLRFRNGTTWSVRQLLRCDLTSEERKTNCQSVPDHWELLHRNQVVLSTALTEWFERVEEYMPKVEDYEVPDPITLGEPFAISGAGYHEGDRVELSIKFSDESVMPLGEVPLEHGAFRWEGEIPETAPSGLANFTMQVLDGTEVVRGITVESVTIAAPTGGSAGAGRGEKLTSAHVNCIDTVPSSVCVLDEPCTISPERLRTSLQRVRRNDMRKC